MIFAPIFGIVVVLLSIIVIISNSVGYAVDRR